jgi:hypothetical protein
VPTVRDIGKTIRVQVTGTATLPGWLTGTAWSAPTTAVLPANAALAPPFVNLVRPRVKGILEVGHRVLVTPGQWEPTPARLTYQWYMGPQAIPGATHHRFLVRDAQLGARLWAKVTARVAWCAPTTVSTRRSEPVLP